MYFRAPCRSYALNCLFVYGTIPGTVPFLTRKQNVVVLFICNSKKLNSNLIK